MNEISTCMPLGNSKPAIAEIHKVIEALNCHAASLVQKSIDINRVVCGASEDSIKLGCPPLTITEIAETGLIQNLNHLDNMLSDIDIVLDSITNRLGIDPKEKA